MSTTPDYVIANANGAAVRSDLNVVFKAIQSNNSSDTEPGDLVSYQWWADTANSVMKLRNAANNGWISLFQLDGDWTNIKLENGTAAAPSLYFKDSGTDTGIYSPGADQVAITTGGTARLYVGSTGLVSIGTSTPRAGLTVGLGNENIPAAGASTGSALFSNATGAGAYGLVVGATSGGLGYIQAQRADGTATTYDVAIQPNGGRLLVGTTSSGSIARLSVQGSTIFNDAFFDLCYNGSAASTIAANTVLGSIRFTDQASNANQFATIKCETDAAVSSASDLPGRLVFSTTPDTQSVPVERMRITNGGHVGIGKTPNGSAGTAGTEIRSDGALFSVRSGAAAVYVGRLASDGSMVEFWQDDIQEGTISVSGTTVSYNGAHLTRWSQIPGIDPHNKTDRPEILRGTVMSNLDEMCEWIEQPKQAVLWEEGEDLPEDVQVGDVKEPATPSGAQDNEQLNKTKISDVLGDKNVAGVFQAWDDDDDTWVNDYYLAMTGDFVIRIAAGTTVERGDLLMSAGDGTAKPQDDDIIRSKTIAKVTSTNVSCTYDDGSYCVPCVLMAC